LIVGEVVVFVLVVVFGEVSGEFAFGFHVFDEVLFGLEEGAFLVEGGAFSVLGFLAFGLEGSQFLHGAVLHAGEALFDVEQALVGGGARAVGVVEDGSEDQAGVGVNSDEGLSASALSSALGSRS
jgi:hypothetical protein